LEIEMTDNKKFLKALLRASVVHQPKVSPDGSWVAFSWFHKTARANIWMVPTDGSSAPIQLTDSTEDMYVVSWTQDTKAVIVACSEDGNERVRLYRINIDKPLKLELLTEERPDYFTYGGDLHPKKPWLFYSANVGPSGKTVLSSHIYRHNVNTGKRKLLATVTRSGEKGRNIPSRTSPSLNSQGTHILYFSAEKHPAGQQARLVDIKGNNDREILNFGDSKKVLASWMPDGKRILFLAEADHYRRLGIYNRGNGSIEWLINDPQLNIEMAWAPKGTDYVVVLEVKDAHERCFLLDVKTRQEVHLSPKQDGGTLIPLAPTPDGNWVGKYYDSVRPQDLVRFTLPKAGHLSGWDELPEGVEPVKTRSLTGQKWTRIKIKDLAKAEDFTWRSVDGLDIHGFLYRAKNPVGTAIVVHGGPRERSEARFDPKVQYLVSEGFTVLLPNYRGSTGYGLAFQDAIKVEGWGGIEQEDIRTGIKALVKAKIAKYGKIVMTGTSYGGYSTWHAITHFPTKLVAAAAPICGMTDLELDYNTTRPDLRTLSEEMMGGTPTQKPKLYRERSPIHFITRELAGDVAQILIVQGGQDPNVTPENVRQVRKALGRAGIVSQLLEFEDEGHGIVRPKNQTVLFTTLAEFFRDSLEE
jgi:dipeptidyl aminopeptidase/acylaminoacyl peptidase